MIKLDSNQTINNKLSFKQHIHPLDLKYKQLLREGIQDTFQFSPKIEDLDSIAGPFELRELLKKFTRKDFLTGYRELDKITSPREFENIKNGDFRANLHIHTNKSDGSMSPQEYLEMSKKYADKVAKIHPNSDIPPYSADTSDHNNIDAAKEIIAAIAEEPKKFKNFKFVSGSEFMFLDNDSPFRFQGFEAMGLGFNPFDAELNQRIQKMNSPELIPTIKKDGGIVSYVHPIKTLQGNGMEPEFIEYLKNKGVNAIESNYQYLNHRNDDSVKQAIEESHRVAEKNNWFKTGGTDSHASNIFGIRAKNILDELLN